MAKKGSSTVTVASSRSITFDWAITAQSPENNTSTVEWELNLYNGSGVQFPGGTRHWSVTVDGTEYSGDNTLYSFTNTTLLASGTTIIQHTGDGTMPFSYSFWQEISETIDDKWIGTIRGAGSGVLDAVPRTSDFTVADGTLGVAQTITIARKSTSFTHELSYSCGSAGTQLICSKNTTAESVSFTPPLDLAWQGTNSDRVWVDIHLQTYDSDGASIGNAVTKGVWMAIPDSVKPSCTVSVSDPTGYAAKYGAYIQGQSKLAIKVTPKTAYGADISAYNITADGNTFKADDVTTPVIQSTGTLTVNASVTDTRSRTGSASASVTVQPYTRPVVNTLIVHRCNADGTENNGGLYASITYGYTVDTLNGKNSVSASIRYKKKTDAEYTIHQLSAEFSVTDGIYIFPADDASVYDVELLVVDEFVGVYHKTTVSTAFTMIHFSPTGKGITFGGISSEDGFHILNMPFSIDGIEIDYIVDQGESDGWLYRKWNSGFAECWKVYSGSGINSAANNSNGFYYTEPITVAFPFTFTNLPTVTVDGGSVGNMNFVRVFGKYSDKASFVVVGMANAGNIDVTVDIKAIGKWK